MRGYRFLVVAMLTFLGLAISACGPTVRTGEPEHDQVLNLVVAREGGFHDCVEVTGVSRIHFLPRGESTPPTRGHVGDWTSEETNAAAAEIAVTFQKAMDAESRDEVRFVFGSQTHSADKEWPHPLCDLSVSTPQFSGDFAFVRYATSSTFGVYAFRRMGSQWKVEERIVSGWI